MNSPFLGMPFSKKNDIILHPHKSLLYLPDITLSLNNTSSSKSVLNTLVLVNISKITILPNQQEKLNVNLKKPTHQYKLLLELLSRHYSLSENLDCVSCFPLARLILTIEPNLE